MTGTREEQQRRDEAEIKEDMVREWSVCSLGRLKARVGRQGGLRSCRQSPWEHGTTADITE